MLKLTAFEFIFRGIPELALFIYATYVFSRVKIEKKKFLLATAALCFTTFTIRMFPISYGIHTILNIAIQTLIVVSICKIDVIKAIRAAILSAIVLFIAELINVALLNIVFRDSITTLFEDKRIKTLCGLPSLAIFAISIILFNIYIKKKEKKDV